MTTAQIVEIRLAGAPGTVQQPLARDELARWLGLLPVQRRLVCYWYRDREGRLTGKWSADIGLVPQL